jgi:hypothetical protein
VIVQPEWLDRAILRTDWFRRPPSRLGGPSGFKEWMHFCVYGDGFDVLANLSETDDLRDGVPSGRSIVRQTLLARRERWTGTVEHIPDGQHRVTAGRTEATFGDGRVSFRDGAYELVMRSRREQIEVELRLIPLVTPTLIHNVTVGDGPPLHWVLIPRLLATGHVRIGDWSADVVDVPAYHDHNWGHFRWGRDFAWEWGFGLPRDRDNPWTFVFARLSNRGLHRTRMQTLFLWRGRHVAAAFRDHQVTIVNEGQLRDAPLRKVPAVMGLISPGGATCVPERMTIDARSEGAWLHAVFIPRDVAQVILPNDDDLGVTIIHEVAGDLELVAQVGDERLVMSCPTIFEFLGS